MASVAWDVGIVVVAGVVIPVDDVVEALLPNGLIAVAVLVVAPGVFVDTPDPMTPGDVMLDVMLIEGVMEELPDPGEDVLLVGVERLLGVEILELVDDGRGDTGAVGVNSSEIPLLPSTDPVWTLAIGLQGIVPTRPGVWVPVGPGVWLGDVPEAGFGGTCATAIDAHATLIQMNRGSFISNLLSCSVGRFTGDLLQSAVHAAPCARRKGSRYRLTWDPVIGIRSS